MVKLNFEHAWLPDGWAESVAVEIDRRGDIANVTPGSRDGERIAGAALPGIPNLHSHAFQRAIAGLGEIAGPGDDSFWTWRQVMYGFLARLTPDDLEAIAAQLYVEMLQSGYTAVGEFHYLHHDPHGRPYANLAEMSERVLAAASATGIGVTHLPVLYGFGGFGGQPSTTGQRRFLNNPERYLRLLETLAEHIAGNPQLALGIAPHSLRAVTPETLAEAVRGIDALLPGAPVHIHIAEQTLEVDQCTAWSGQRPVAWLFDHQDVGPRWCLVHATHIDNAERDQLAASRAVAGLCPATEANLGDGLFPARAFLDAGGHIGIGSDSHISVSPVEELRWLEYGQRLWHRQRNVLASGPGTSTGASLLAATLVGGAQALGRPIGRIAPGTRADIVVLDRDTPVLVGAHDASLIDAWLFAGNHNAVREVLVGGHWVVQNGRHRHQDAIYTRYRKVMRHLANET